MNYGFGNTLYFLGIGGIGMSALARYFHSRGAAIHGYDRVCTPLTRQLEDEGMTIHYDEDVLKIPHSVDLVIITPAIPSNHVELIAFKEGRAKIMKRAEVLGALTKGFFTIAIAGTHGKTTITSIVAHILYTANKRFTAFIGGIANNFNSNLVLNQHSDYMVVEADEYDKSFLMLKPDIAVISSMDADHLDIYGSHQQMIQTYHDFANNISKGGTLILQNSITFTQSEKVVSYGLSADCDVFADQIRIESGKFHFTLQTKLHRAAAVKMQVAGRHNIENALAAAAVAFEIGIDLNTIVNALETYTGVWRRFDVKVNNQSVVYIDDYAHHPEELRACIQAVRELYPNKKITGIFQPHLYSRTYDLMQGFSESLSLLDTLILLDIYAARETPVEGISAASLLQLVSIKNKTLLSKNEVATYLNIHRPEVLLTLGAGDIDQLVLPIQQQLSTW